MPLGNAAPCGICNSTILRMDMSLCLFTSCLALCRNMGIFSWGSNRCPCFGSRNLCRSSFCLIRPTQGRWSLRNFWGLALFSSAAHACRKRRSVHCIATAWYSSSSNSCSIGDHRTPKKTAQSPPNTPHTALLSHSPHSYTFHTPSDNPSPHPNHPQSTD